MGTFCPRQETKMRLLVAAVLVAATSAAPTPEADPQFIATPYVYPYQPAVQTVPAVTSYTPTVYSADPGFFVQLPPGGGKYLPDVFGWERGSEYYKKWLGCPTALCKNRVKWRTDGQRFKTYQPGGADPNKFTDKYSDPGQYQGRKKRDAEADPQYFATPTYTTAVIAPSYGTPAVLPVIYEAEPGFFVQLTPGSGKFLPGLFPNRGPSYFDQWLEPPFGQGNQVHWSTDGQKMGPYQPGGADPNKFTDKYSKRSADAEPKPEPQYYVSQFVDPMTGAKGYYPVVPATSYVQPTVQTVQPVQTVPQVSYVQAAPHTRTVYTADPMFFNFGRYFNNNLGGKADYGHDAGRRKYPTYGDYYRTHRYPLNDGWMLWDEDLRDLDSKSNKIGLGKDGGR